jgi:hypothetical protein
MPTYVATLSGRQHERSTIMSTDPRPPEADGEASPDVEQELTDEELATATGGRFDMVAGSIYKMKSHKSNPQQ